jgi:hypothetical protein
MTTHPQTRLREARVKNGSTGLVLSGPLAWLLLCTPSIHAAPENASFVYKGQLSNGPGVAQGTFSMAFQLYGSPSGTDAVGAPFVFAAVPVTAGEFSVVIGPLTDAQLAQDPLFLGVTVNGVTLRQRQRIYPVPFAMRGKGDSAFQTSVPMTVNGKLTSTGGLEVAGSDLQLGTADGRSVGPAPLQRALVHGTSDELIINFGRDFGGGTVIQSDVGVQGGLSAGSLTATSVVADNIPQRLFQVTLNSGVAPANILPADFNGANWRRLRVEVEGFMDVVGADNGYMGVRPNGSTSSYGAQSFAWQGHVPGTSFPFAAGGINTIGFPDSIPMCVTHYNQDGHVMCTLEMNTRSGMARLGHAKAMFATSGTCGTSNCVISTDELGSWRDTNATLTSLGVTFGNLTSFNGTITVWGTR